MKDLTGRQREILKFIESYIAENSYPPAIRDIAESFSITPKGAHDHVAALRRKGFLSKTEGRSRSLIPLKDDEGTAHEGFASIPVLGNISAGKPIMSEENLSGFVRVDNSMLKKQERYFALKVCGDSMTGAGVMDGDTVIIEKGETAQNRDIVVAWVDEKVTLKRYFRESNRIRLQAENPAYPTRYSKNVRLEGRLVCVIRTY
jgi:repressor LexA